MLKSMLGWRRRRRANIGSTLGRCVVFAGIVYARTLNIGAIKRH